MLKVGLTGGIASGKTTVANLFAKLGTPLIDADAVTRELMQPNKPIGKKIIEHFGENILHKSGEINRGKIADIIFNNADEKKWLENLVHPAVREAMTTQLKTFQAPYCILMIPLLVETLPNPLVDRILVVDCQEKQQLERLQRRDNLTVEMAKKMMGSQASRQQRLKLADDVIENYDTMDNLKNQVRQLHNYYLEIATNPQE